MPIPPAWIVRKLKEINPRFGIAWDDTRKMWTITEEVRRVEQVAEVDGAPVFKMHRRAETALRFKGLGSKMLDYVRRNDPRKYRSVVQMVEKLGIDKGARPEIPASVA